MVCGPLDAPCSTHFEIYKHMRLLWMKYVCSKGEFDEWHKLEYVLELAKIVG